MDTYNLAEVLNKLKAESKYQNFIININGGTTIYTAFDDFISIKKVLDSNKQEHWNYSMHMDGAFYGPTIPILK